jgi:hypothetical protein
MAISIPSTVFTKYKEFADAMIADFGVNCKLQDRNDAAGFARGSKKFKTVENTEDIKLRVYWNRKDWVKVGEIDIPDGAIQTIGYLSDFTSINKAKALIVNSDIDGYREYRFIKAAEPFPWGFKQDRYMVCFWTRE